MINIKKLGLSTLLLSTGLAHSFSETNIQFMKGNSFKYSPTSELKQNVTTFEHVSSWRYGDNYFFFDVTDINKSGTTYYGEWHPRFSLSKITGKEISYGPVRDYLLALQVNTGTGASRTYLYGAGLDWNIPGFYFVTSNLYVRNEIDKKGTGVQLTMAWAYPIEVMNSKFKLEGFFDWNMKEYNKTGTPSELVKRNILIEPQLLYDLGHSVGLGDSRLYLGVEYTYWKNKYGINDLTEKNLKYMVKFYL